MGCKWGGMRGVRARMCGRGACECEQAGEKAMDWERVMTDFMF